MALTGSERAYIERRVLALRRMVEDLAVRLDQVSDAVAVAGDEPAPLGRLP